MATNGTSSANCDRWTGRSSARAREDDLGPIRHPPSTIRLAGRAGGRESGQASIPDKARITHYALPITECSVRRLEVDVFGEFDGPGDVVTAELREFVDAHRR